jgi:hypothetical protein
VEDRILIRSPTLSGCRNEHPKPKGEITARTAINHR